MTELSLLARFMSILKATLSECDQVRSHGLQLQVPMDDPYCSCELTPSATSSASLARTARRRTSGASGS